MDLAIVLAPVLLLLFLNRGIAINEGKSIANYAFMLIAWPQIAELFLLSFKINLNEFIFVAVRFLPAILFGLAYILIEKPSVLRKSAIFFVVPGIISLVFGILNNQTVLYPIAWIGIALPFLFETKVRPQSHLFSAVYSRCVVGVSVAVLLVTLLNPVDAISRCRSDKCNVLGFVFSPEGGQSNVLSLTFGLIIATLDISRSYTWILANSCCLIALANFSGGRSGTWAGLACFISISIFKLVKRHFKYIYSIFLFLTFLFSLAPVIIQFNALSFTGRPILWDAAKNFISQSPYFGHGASFWIRLQATNELQANYSPHNVWLELLVSVGVVGTLVTILAAISSLKTIDGKLLPVAFSLLIGLLVSGFSESMIMPYRLIITPGFWLLFICVSSFQKTHELGAKQ